MTPIDLMQRFGDTGRPRVATSSVLLFPIRMFLGFGWLRAGIEKAIDPDWWTGDSLRRFLDDFEDETLPFMAPFVDVIVEPFIVVVAVFVMLLQFAVGVSFVTTRLLRPALWGGVMLNTIFVAMGAVDPSAFYLAIEVSLLAGVALGVFGSQRRAPSPVGVGLKVGLAGALTPFVRTLAPAEVIHDPAIVLVTILVLAAATEALGWFVRIDDGSRTATDLVGKRDRPRSDPTSGAERGRFGEPELTRSIR